MSFWGKLTKAGINPWGDPVSATLAGTSGQILVIMRDKNRDILQATGTDVPANATSGYAKGCLFIDRDVATGTTGLYENIGTNTSCNFNAIGAISAGEITLATGSILLGTAGVAAALDAKTSGTMLYGNGTTVVNGTFDTAGVVAKAGAQSIAGIKTFTDGIVCEDGEFKLGAGAGTAVTATAAELNYNDITTLGTGAASKAVVLDTGGNYAMPSAGMFGLSRGTLAAAGSGASDAAVITQQVTVVTGSNGTLAVALPAAATATGPILVVNSVTTTGATLPVFPVNGGNDNINALAEDAAFTMGPGSAAWFIPVSATQWYVHALAAITPTVAEINTLLGMTATAAEIVRTCDLTGRIVTLVETGAITEILHEGRVCMLGEVGGNALVTLTLPEATGSGARYKFIVSVLNTSSYVIVVADTTNANFIGNVINQDADLVGTIAAIMYPAPANADTLTLNGTSTGGQVGDWVELIDVATDVWFVNGVVSCPAGSDTATPFSAAV